MQSLQEVQKNATLVKVLLELTVVQISEKNAEILHVALTCLKKRKGKLDFF